MEALARAHAVDQERERLMRDMHDGVGSQLMTTLAAVERDELDSPAVAALLRDCIADLRLVIDSLEPEQRSLQLALANLRYRLEPQLQAAGIRLQWVVPADAGTASAWPPGTVLQVLRIVQEGLVNAIRHSGRVEENAGLGATHAKGLNYPTGLALAGKRLIVADNDSAAIWCLKRPERYQADAEHGWRCRQPFFCTMRRLPAGAIITHRSHHVPSLFARQCRFIIPRSARCQPISPSQAPTVAQRHASRVAAGGPSSAAA